MKVEQEDEESDGRQDRMYLSLILPSFNYSFRQVDLLVFYEIKFKVVVIVHILHSKRVIATTGACQIQTFEHGSSPLFRAS